MPCAHLCPIQEDPRCADEPWNEHKKYGWSDSVAEALALQATSFNNECRVFGRLKEVGREDLAVRTHGYMPVYLNEQVEDQFKIAIANSDSPGTKSGAELLGHENPEEPLMAIVKDWAEDEPDHGELLPRTGDFPKMLRNLKALHKCGIVVRDLKDQQYRNGVLVDFSHA